MVFPSGHMKGEPNPSHGCSALDCSIERTHFMGWGPRFQGQIWATRTLLAGARPIEHYGLCSITSLRRLDTHRIPQLDSHEKFPQTIANKANAKTWLPMTGVVYRAVANRCQPPKGVNSNGAGLSPLESDRVVSKIM